jgi:hypothetical protein
MAFALLSIWSQNLEGNHWASKRAIWRISGHSDESRAQIVTLETGSR